MPCRGRNWKRDARRRAARIKAQLTAGGPAYRSVAEKTPAPPPTPPLGLLPPWEGPDELPELRERLAAIRSQCPAREHPTAPNRPAPVVCPDCGSPMRLRETTKYRYDDGRPRKFWGCSRYPDCTAAHGAHPDGRPLGVPGDAATKALRMECHAVVDRLWQSGRKPRAEVYRGLARFLGVPEHEAHIGHLSADQCRRVISSYGHWR
jgi:hypothetical protein